MKSSNTPERGLTGSKPRSLRDKLKTFRKGVVWVVGLIIDIAALAKIIYELYNGTS